MINTTLRKTAIIVGLLFMQIRAIMYSTDAVDNQYIESIMKMITNCST